MRPVWQATDSDCGPACVTWLLRRWGLTATLTYCTEALHTSERDGTDPRTIEAFLRGQGLKVLAGEMEESDLKEQCRKGRPVLLTLRGHYVVAVSVNRGKVSVMNPTTGDDVMRMADLVERWNEVDRLGAVYDCWGLAVWN